MIRPFEDDSQAVWIETSIRSQAHIKERTARVLVPPFPAYVKVFHAIHRVRDGASGAAQDELDAFRQRVGIDAPLEAWSTGGQLSRRGTTRLRWPTLAREAGLGFGPGLTFEALRSHWGTTWVELFDGPAEGCLDGDSLEGLTEVLAKRSQEACFFRSSPIAVSLNVIEPVSWRGGLDELSSWMMARTRLHVTPEYWWPASQAWCVVTDYDLAYTFVGGDAECIRSIADHPLLDALVVTPDEPVF